MNANSIQLPVFMLNSLDADSFKISTKLPDLSPRSVFNLRELFDEDIDEKEICKFFIEGRCKYSEKCKNYHPRVVSDAECSLCKAKVRASFRQFGILSNCNDVFCLPCIRQWRGRGNVNISATRACPICHIKSRVLIPSNFLILDHEDKVKLLGSEKDGEHCRYIVKGKCPFGENCLYDHETNMQKDFAKA